MAAQRKAEIEALLGPTVQALGLELWGSELALSRAGGLLRLYIDHHGPPGHAGRLRAGQPRGLGTARRA
jgi:ribosome maturation factor RimP